MHKMKHSTLIMLVGSIKLPAEHSKKLAIGANAVLISTAGYPNVRRFVKR
jgi:hypothetical protein